MISSRSIRPFLAALLAVVPATAAAQNRGALPLNGPTTQPPELLNASEVTALAVSSYPEELKSLGLGGSPLVRLYISETGAITERRIERSSALPALDSAALKVVDAMRFRPAMNGSQPTHLWVTLPVQFRIAVANVQTAPVRTPPRVLNLYEVEKTLGNRMAYRTTRAGHWPRISVFVAADGTAQAVEIRDPSGDAALDAAALHACLESRFAPALDAAGQPVATWFDITVRPSR